jgi:hypothetical protein
MRAPPPHGEAAADGDGPAGFFGLSQAGAARHTGTAAGLRPRNAVQTDRDAEGLMKD